MPATELVRMMRPKLCFLMWGQAACTLSSVQVYRTVRYWTGVQNRTVTVQYKCTEQVISHVYSLYCTLLISTAQYSTGLQNWFSLNCTVLYIAVQHSTTQVYRTGFLSPAQSGRSHGGAWSEQSPSPGHREYFERLENVWHLLKTRPWAWGN